MDDEQPRPVRFMPFSLLVIHELAQHPSITQERLAGRLGVTLRTVQRTITHLEEEGYLRVDRTQKPFRYTIDWSRPLPQVPRLRLILFHPDLAPALQRLSAEALEVYESEQNAHRDPAEALRHLMRQGAGTSCIAEEV